DAVVRAGAAFWRARGRAAGGGGLILYGGSGTMTIRTRRQQRMASRPAGGRLRGFKPQAEPLEERVVLDFRSITGLGNNVANPTWGSAGVALLRAAPAAYADGISAPVVGNPARPSPRAISNAVVAQTTEERVLSDRQMAA